MTATHALELPRADFTRVDPRAVALLAERWARRHLVIPIALERGTLVVATCDPLDLDAERAIAFATGHRIRWEFATADEIARQLDWLYTETQARQDAAAPPVEVQHLGFVADGTASDAAADGASVIRLVDQLLAEAISAGASDLHLEPEEQGIAVRHRVDGVLRQVRTLSRSVAPSLVSRVKILSALDIADRMRPQDGRARVAVFGSVVDLRVSTLPVSHGEKIVVRVLDGSAGLRTLEAAGFAPNDLRRIRNLLEQREGLVLVTGPTGSGKTTTLYAALREIQSRGVNVVTVEDPIEYRLPGIVQVQVHERAGLTFGAALRSIMRQDPDVILVGEIRDRETAEIAIQASLTGHLVLSTLHTNDAASAVTRLIDIGVAGYQISTAIKGVIAQRLVRRVCTECRGASCASCDGGYRGRRAVAEILTTSAEFERRVSAGAPTESLAEAARASGCISLWDSGMALVQSGETTIDELRRVAAPPVRLVTERALAPTSALPTIAVAWALDVPLSGANEHMREAQAAAKLFGGTVSIEPLSLPADEAKWALPQCDAIVVQVGKARAIRSRVESVEGAHPLVVALASNRPVGEDVSTLARHADLMLSADASGRLVLASILALLRWRSTRTGRHHLHSTTPMAIVNVGTIAVHLVAYEGGEWSALALQRSLDTRCPGSWETVHGTIELGEEPEEAAIREVREETGLVVQRLYNVTVQPFYLHRTHTVELSVVFAALVDRRAAVTLGREHARYEWLPASEALQRLFWPRERAALQEVMDLLRTGDGGDAEDVLRVR